MAGTDYLITIVHGTFAKNADWVKDESIFCKKIRELLKTNVTFSQHSWTGNNTHTDRVKAGRELAGKLQEQITKEPTKRKIIIAHSHGGNIALYALRILKDKSSNFDLITMGTPFLNSSRRHFTENLQMHLYATSVIIALVYMVFSTIIIYETQSFLLTKYGIKGDTLIIPTLALMLANIYVIFTKIFPKTLSFLRKAAKNIPDKIDSILDSVSYSKENNKFSIFAVIDKKDEIKIWFRNVHSVWLFFISIYDFICRIAGNAVYIVLGLMLFAVILLIANEAYFRESIIFYVVLQICNYLLILFVLLPFFTVSISLLLYLLKSNPLVLGWESWQHQLFIKTVPDSKPFGYENIKFLEYSSIRKSTFDLKHSIYLQEKVITDISNWIIQK
ncbi:MAG: hypothetical protein KF862_01115 [Chitinophagaceae bacterium]|nr:hypothetical protein [Chitinophagaceae bacterium]